MEWEGADRAWEYIFDEYTEVRYELYGPEGFDEEYAADLKAEGRWEEELAAWDAPLPCKKKELEIRERCLEWALVQCRRSSNFYRKKHHQYILPV